MIDKIKNKVHEVRQHHPPYWGLFGLALLAIGHAWSYGPWVHPTLPLGLDLMTRWIPMPVFALLWLLAGVTVLIEGARGRPGWGAVGGVMGMTMLWGNFYLVGFIVQVFDHIPSRSYISAIIYIGVALYIWGNIPPDPDEYFDYDDEIQDDEVE